MPWLDHDVYQSPEFREAGCQAVPESSSRVPVDAVASVAGRWIDLSSSSRRSVRLGVFLSALSSRQFSLTRHRDASSGPRPSALDTAHHALWRSTTHRPCSVLVRRSAHGIPGPPKSWLTPKAEFQLLIMTRILAGSRSRMEEKNRFLRTGALARCCVSLRPGGRKALSPV